MGHLETVAVTPQVIFRLNDLTHVEGCQLLSEQVSYRRGAGNWITEQNLHKAEAAKNVTQWITAEGQSLTSGLNIPGRFTIVSLWLTKSAPGEHFEPHAHPLSFISGSYYFTDEPEEVCLMQENLWQEYPLANGADVISPLRVRQGDLVFIPSRMRHCVPIVQKERKVLSFNAVLTDIDTCSGKETQTLVVPAQAL